MKIEDRVKKIQWLFAASILIALFSKFSYQHLTMEFFKLYEFEETLIQKIFVDGMNLHAIDLYTWADDKYNKEDWEKGNAFVSLLKDNFIYKDEFKSIPSDLSKVHYTRVRFEVDNSYFFNISGEIYDLIGETDFDQNNTNDVISYDIKTLIIGKYIREFALLGKCNIRINRSEKNHFIKCSPIPNDRGNTDLIFIKDYDQFVMPIDKSDDSNKRPLDLKGQAKDIENLTKNGVNLPLVNTQVSIFEIGLGIIFVAFFIQIYALSNIRSLSVEKTMIDDWLFVSWIHTVKNNIIDKVSIAIESLVGVVAYISLTVWPVYSIWNALQMQGYIEGRINYAIFNSILVCSGLLSAFILYYLIRNLKNNLRIRADNQSPSTIEVPAD